MLLVCISATAGLCCLPAQVSSNAGAAVQHLGQQKVPLFFEQHYKPKGS